MAQLRIQLLGTPQITVDGNPVQTDRRKAIALLAYLAVTAVPHTRERLATLFWPESDQSRALAYLRRTLWELNNILGEGWLSTDREQAALPSQTAVWLDVAAFETQIAQDSIPALKEAVALYQGTFMAGFTLPDSPDFDAWQAQQADHWQQQLAGALARLSKLLAEAGDLATAVSTAQQWLNLDQLDEAAHRQLMRLYAAAGQRSHAIRQYETCVQQLQAELGIGPSDETNDLYQSITSGQFPAASAPDIAATPTPAKATLRLPIPPTPFIGRRAMLAEIGTLLDQPQHRMISLVGSGGMGKTRLAIQLAAEKAADFADGVCFVPLAPLESAAEIVPAVARALNLTFQEREEAVAPREQLLAYLTGKQLLLILDNFEHLLADTAVNGETSLPQAILEVAPQSQILITSRIRLNLQSETVYAVGGMDVPETAVLSAAEGEQYSSVKLFAASAKRVRSGFALTPDTLEQVVQICRLVAGMPLAIELAAGWLELLTLTEIQAEINQNLDFLETEWRDIPERQRSIRAIFESTWRLLTAEEQAVFAKLSLFTSGFTREAAQAVTGASLRLLMGLANKSIIRRGADGRYTIHDLLRQYAAGRLRADPAAWEAAHEEYSAYYLAFFRRWGPQMVGPDQGAAFTAVDEERTHIQAAWQWRVNDGRLADLDDTLDIWLVFYLARTFTERDAEMLWTAVEKADQLADPSLRLFRIKCQVLYVWFNANHWYLSGGHSIGEIIKSVYEEIKGKPIVPRMSVYIGLLGLIMGWRIDPDEGMKLVREAYQAQAPDGDKWTATFLAYLMATQCTISNDLEEARLYLAESMQLNQELQNPLGRVYTLELLADLHSADRGYETALETLKEAQTISRELGNHMGVASTLDQLGHTSFAAGDYERAISFFQEACQVYKDAGHLNFLVSTESWLSIVFTRTGHLEEALAYRERSLSGAGAAPESVAHAWHLWEMGELQRLLGDLAAARRWYDKARPMFEKMEALGMVFYYRGLGDLAYGHGRYRESVQHFSRSLQIATGELVLAQPVNHNWSATYALCGLGRALLTAGQPEAALSHFHQALVLADQVMEIGLSMVVFTGFSQVWAATGAAEEAVRLGAFVQAHPATWHEYRQQVTAVLAQLQAALPPDAFTQAEADGRAANYETVLQHLLSAITKEETKSD